MKQMRVIRMPDEKEESALRYLFGNSPGASDVLHTMLCETFEGVDEALTMEDSVAEIYRCQGEARVLRDLIEMIEAAKREHVIDTI